jgi:signal transduction histidine kinase
MLARRPVDGNGFVTVKPYFGPMTRMARPKAEPLQSDPLGRDIELPRGRYTALDETRRAFLRVISHELRTPLNSIIGFSEIIAGELYGPLGAPQYREYAEHVRRSGHRLLKLVNQVLEIARLEGGTLDLAPAPCPLINLLDDVADSLRQDLKDRNVLLDIADEADLPTVLVDEKGARSLLFNLLQNAVLHGAAPGVVTVRARRLGPMARIDIHNEGGDVAPDQLPRLLAPFRQDDALSNMSHRTGLGLPIARLLAEAMGGALTLDSAPGEGFTASLTLPVA